MIAVVLLERRDWLIGSCAAGHAGMFFLVFFIFLIRFILKNCFKAFLHTFAIKTNSNNVCKTMRQNKLECSNIFQKKIKNHFTITNWPRLRNGQD